MEQMRTVYIIRTPCEGQPDGFHTLCRALTPAGAAEVMRALLDTKDPKCAEVRVIRSTEFVPAGEYT